MDVFNRVAIGENPWNRYLNGGMAIHTLFILSPLVILIVASLSYIEHRANGWKYIYTMPTTRGYIFLSKLLMVLLILVFTSLIIIVLLVVGGYILGWLLPEYEFGYYSPDIGSLFAITARGIISCLGIIAIQFVLNLFFRNFILSLGIGFFGYIVGFVFATIDKKMILFNPYTYPLIDQDFGFFDCRFKVAFWDAWLTNVEVYSISIFIVVVGLGYLYEIRRSVRD